MWVICLTPDVTEWQIIMKNYLFLKGRCPFVSREYNYKLIMVIMVIS